MVYYINKYLELKDTKDIALHISNHLASSLH